MKFEVPDEFIELLEEIEKDVPPINVLKWLEWAAQNPEGAKRLVEGCKRLGRSGRYRLAVGLWFGDDPDRAMESAVKSDADRRRERSLLSKVMAHAKRKGYEFTMPNGVKCTVVQDKDGYWFRFKVEGEEIGILYGCRGLLYVISSWKSGLSPGFRIRAASYKGIVFIPSASKTEMLIKAIEENMKPEVAAAVNP